MSMDPPNDLVGIGLRFGLQLQASARMPRFFAQIDSISFDPDSSQSSESNHRLILLSKHSKPRVYLKILPLYLLFYFTGLYCAFSVKQKNLNVKSKGLMKVCKRFAKGLQNLKQKVRLKVKHILA